MTRVPLFGSGVDRGAGGPALLQSGIEIRGAIILVLSLPLQGCSGAKEEIRSGAANAGLAAELSRRQIVLAAQRIFALLPHLTYGC